MKLHENPKQLFSQMIQNKMGERESREINSTITQKKTTKTTTKI